MKAIKIFSSVGIVLTLILALMPVASVSANTRTVDIVDESFGPNPIPCNDITVMDQRYGSAYLAYHYDNLGNLDKVIWTTKGSVYETWTGPNGKILTFKYMGPAVINYYTDGSATIKVLGVEGVANLPGYGHIYGQAGQLIMNWPDANVTYKQVGMIDYDLTPEELNAVCTYLSN